MPRVSVIIPTHNQAHFIQATIASVLDQTYSDFEIIIVNDASTDETLKTIAALRDTRIQVFSLEHNQGESAATNYAIHQARGEFVAILHSDDLWASDKLQKQVEFLEKNPQFGAVLTRVQVIDEKSDILPENSHLLQRLFLQPNRTRFQWLHYFFTKDNGLCQTSTMIRRECYDTVGFYDVRFRQIPDFDFWVRFCQHYDLYIVPEYLTQYRVHQSNISGICSETIIRHTTEVFQILKHYRSAAVYKHLFQIFPELLECYPTLNNTSLESSQALFLLANQALKVSRPTHQLFGLEILYQLLRQPNIATQLEKNYGFNYQTLAQFAGAYDIFGLQLDPLIKNHGTKPSVKHPSGLPLVSLIIPTYNGEKFITIACESAIAQTYSNLEIIISDDGSTDQTLERVEAFKVRSGIPLKIFKHANYGLVKNLNFCVEQAQGKYIKFLFQDDLLEPECITKMVDLAEKDDEVGLVFSPREVFIHSDSTPYPLCQAAYQGAKDIHQDWSELKPIQSGQTLLCDPQWLVGRLNKIGEPTTVLIPKFVFETLGGFDPELHQLLDVDFWFRILGNYKVGFINQSLSKLRIHTGQQTQKNISDQENLKDYQRLYQKMLDSPEYNFLTPELKQIVFRKLLVKSQDLRPLTLQLLDQYHRKANPLALENLRQLRLQVAGKWLNASVDTLESLYQSSLKEVHQMLIQSSLQVELLTGSERQLVNQLTQRLNQGIHTSHHLKALLAVMLYQPACQINLNYQNAIIPGYFFQDFLNYLWDSSPWIIGSNLQQWIQFNRGLLKYLHTNLELAHCTDSHLDFWHHVVAVFTKVSNTPAWNSDNYSAKKSQELLQDLFNDRAQFLQLNT